MTKEEIIGGLQFTIDMFLLNPNTGENREEYELNDMDKTTIDACKGAIELLRQEPKRGHWIKLNEHYRCSECSLTTSESGKLFYNYCPNCGCLMEEK